MKTASEQSNNSVFDLMLSTLISLEKKGGSNHGIRVDPKSRQVHTYTQVRDALSYVYLKRNIKQDGINSEPLNITLTSCKLKS